MKYIPILLFIATALLLQGCDFLGEEATDGIVCTLEARPALLVNIQSDSPEPTIIAVTAREGTYADSSTFSLTSSGRASLAHERAGTYVVTIERSGNEVWRRSGVGVQQGICHVKTITLDAVL
jgi:hypothetical protein